MKVATHFLIFNAALGGLGAAVLGSAALNAGYSSPLKLALVAVVAFSYTAGIWCLLSQHGKESVVYIRTFKTDQHTAYLRRILKAGLGPRFRLCGVRAPKVRDNMVQRCLGSLGTGLRYLGSPYLELEAGDHNWMARLLATLARSRFALLDICSMTDNVAAELQLAYLGLGRERSIFLIDNSREEESWREYLAHLLGISVEEAAAIKLLQTEGYPQDIADRAAQMARMMPQGATSINSAAFSFARARVSHWRSAWWERNLGQFVFSILITEALVFCAQVILVQIGLQFLTAESIVMGLILIGLTILFVAAWRRERAQEYFARTHSDRIGYNTERSIARIRLSMGLVVLGSLLLFPAVIFRPVLARTLRSTMIKHQEFNLRQLSFALQMYAIDNKDRYPRREDWKVELEKGGYVDPSILNILATDVWGHDVEYQSFEDGRTYRMRSAGEDGIFDTADDIQSGPRD